MININRNPLGLLMPFFMILTLMNSVLGSSPLDQYLGEFSLTSRAIIGSISILLGLILVFAGKKVVKLLLFVSGAALFGIGSFLIARNIVQLDHIEQNQKIAVYAGCSIAALVGGVIALCCYQLGVMLVGGVLGFSLANLILRTNVISNHNGQIILVVCMVVAFAVMAFLISNIILVIGTSMIGATLTIFGVDMFTLTGFDNFLFSIKSGGDVTPTTTSLWIMIVSLVVLAVAGIFVQFISARSRN